MMTTTFTLQALGTGGIQDDQLQRVLQEYSKLPQGTTVRLYLDVSTSRAWVVEHRFGILYL